MEKSLLQVTSDYDDSFAKKEADWQIILLPSYSNPADNDSLPAIWRPGQQFQVYILYIYINTCMDDLIVMATYAVVELLKNSKKSAAVPTTGCDGDKQEQQLR